MPTQSDKLTELRENAAPGELPYISKSRVTTYKTCPRKFYYSYIKGLRGPSNFYMKRGTRVHTAFETYYENIIDEWEKGVFHNDLSMYLPEDTLGWADFTEPFITNFLLFEYRRLDAVGVDNLEAFLPVGIEAEGWDDEAAPPWMGYADVILKAASVPDLEENEGVVIVDFKTGKTPKKQYRDDGIFLEGEYYAMLFEGEWDIAAVAGYFPKNDDFIVSPLDDERRERIYEYVAAMTESDLREHFAIKAQPLCAWSSEEGSQCDFYQICSSRWGCVNGPGPNYFDENKNPL